MENPMQIMEGCAASAGDGLVPQADAQNRRPVHEARYHVQKPPGLLGYAGTGRQHDLVNSFEAIPIESVAGLNFDLPLALQTVFDQAEQIVGKGIMIVDNEDFQGIGG